MNNQLKIRKKAFLKGTSLRDYLGAAKNRIKKNISGSQNWHDISDLFDSKKMFLQGLEILLGISDRSNTTN